MHKILVLLVCLVFISFSCKNDNAPASFDTQTDFPLLVNAQWTYRITDSTIIPVKVDTITLKIISNETVVDSQIWHCQLYKHNAIVDEGTYTQYGGYISYRGNNLTSYFGNFILQFPMTTSSVWPGIYQQDTFSVLNMKSGVNILGVPYNNVYTVNRKFMQVDFSISQTLLYSKGLGIAQQNFSQYSIFGSTHYFLELISYSLH